MSAFGFGGSNFHCVLEEAGPEKPEVDWDGDVQIVALSADDPAELTAAFDALDDCGDWDEIRSAAADSRSRFEPVGCHRALLVARRGGSRSGDTGRHCASTAGNGFGTSFAALVRSTCQRRPASGGKGAFSSGTDRRTGQLAMLFPGQGSQYVGMLRELACRFPRMQQALALVERRPPDTVDVPLSDRIYPRPVFDERERLAQEAGAARDTRIAQPAIGAVSLGLLWITRGVRGSPGSGRGPQLR